MKRLPFILVSAVVTAAFMNSVAPVQAAPVIKPQQPRPTSPPIVMAKPIEDPVKDLKPIETVEPIPVPAPVPTPTPKPVPVTQPTPVFSGSNQELMAAAGIAASDFQAVDYILRKESSWNFRAVNASSGATGLCQALPASKMASAGADYLTNPVTQLRWCDGYAKARYGGWWPAYNFWTANHWW